MIKPKSKSQQLLSLVILAGVAAWGAWYIKEHSEDLTILLNITIRSLIPLFTFAIIKLLVTGFFTKVIVSSFGIQLDFSEWFGLSAITTMGNYLSPFRGGAAIRGVYLKSKHGLSYSHFLSTLSVFLLLSFSTSAVIGLIALISLWYSYSVVSYYLLVFLGFCLFSPVILYIISKLSPTYTGKWTKILYNVVEGWSIISKQPRTVFYLIILSILNAGTTLAMIHLSFGALGYRLPLIKSLLVSTLFLISAMIPITPAGLGVAELAMVITSNTLNINGSVSLFAAGLNRSVIIITSIILGVLYSYILSIHGSSYRVPSEGEQNA